MNESPNSHRSADGLSKPKYFTQGGYELQIGDHLIVKRSCYTHHGIYFGDRMVIHYSGLSDGFTSGPVTYDALEIFSGGSEITVRKYSSPAFKGVEVINRAVSRFGEEMYDLHSNNCEDFCSWAITGKSGSDQVEFVETVAGIFFPLISTAAQVRKHVSRKDPKVDGGSVTGEIAKTVLKGALMTALPVSMPVRIAGEALRRIFK